MAIEVRMTTMSMPKPRNTATKMIVNIVEVPELPVGLLQEISEDSVRGTVCGWQAQTQAVGRRQSKTSSLHCSTHNIA